MENDRKKLYNGRKITNFLSFREDIWLIRNSLLAEALTAAGAKGYLVPAGLCVVPAEPLEPTLHLTKADLTDAPMIAAGGKKMILSTSVTGFQPGEEMTLETDGERRQGLILERMVEADTAYGEWKTQLVVQLR